MRPASLKAPLWCRLFGTFMDEVDSPPEAAESAAGKALGGGKAVSRVQSPASQPSSSSSEELVLFGTKTVLTTWVEPVRPPLKQNPPTHTAQMRMAHRVHQHAWFCHVVKFAVLHQTLRLLLRVGC